MQGTDSQRRRTSASERTVRRRLPIGAEITPDGVYFRVWAPKRKQVSVVLEGDAESATNLEPEANGYFSGLVREGEAGTLYRFRLDGEKSLLPDPASRFQPDGPHGPSQVIDPDEFKWTDGRWKGISPENQVFYEMHIGTFTKEGTYAAAERELAELARLGITCLEVMPLADFPGRFGWGYDGVDLFAPTRLYGKPDELRHFIDRAHSVGLGVILDVVYNHFGPDGNYLKEFSDHYASTRHHTEWGEALNFDDPFSKPVREFFVANGRYWVEEFHFDGFRFDATQAIFDDSKDHILAAVVREAKAAAPQRGLYFVAENESQETVIVRDPKKGGRGLTALWNDDFHHSALVVLSGRNEAYYMDYLGKPQEFISSIKYGYLYQGQLYKWQEKRRGTPALDLPPTAFVNYLENHDQVANSARGARIHQIAGFNLYKTMTALLLLAPQTPLLFQGQEFAASSPFLYFADHGTELNLAVCEGRGKSMCQFPSAATEEMQRQLADPGSEKTFLRCKLDFSERERNAAVYSFHRDLLAMRRDEPAFRARRPGGIDGAVLGPDAFLLRFFPEGGEDRLLLINFGVDLHLDPSPEPLLAPPFNRAWRMQWSTEMERYGGNGTPPLETDDNWLIPGRTAVVLEPIDAADAPPLPKKNRNKLHNP